MDYTSITERRTSLGRIVVQIRSELTNLGDADDTARLDLGGVIQNCMDSLLLHVCHRRSRSVLALAANGLHLYLLVN